MLGVYFSISLNFPPLVHSNFLLYRSRKCKREIKLPSYLNIVTPTLLKYIYIFCSLHVTYLFLIIFFEQNIIFKKASYFSFTYILIFLNRKRGREIPNNLAHCSVSIWDYEFSPFALNASFLRSCLYDICCSSVIY